MDISVTKIAFCLLKERTLVMIETDSPEYIKEAIEHEDHETQQEND